MVSRLEFQAYLETLVDNVYFQPPDKSQLVYPCIIYDLTDLPALHADNAVYILDKEYAVTIITRDPDSELPLNFVFQQKTKFDRVFKSDGLYHFIYTIIF